MRVTLLDTGSGLRTTGRGLTRSRRTLGAETYRRPHAHTAGCASWDNSGVGSTVAAHRDAEPDIHKLPGNCRFEPSPYVVREGPWKDTGMPSPYRWVIVGLGGLMGCVAIGAMFS